MISHRCWITVSNCQLCSKFIRHTSSGTLACQSHIVRIASEILNVSLHPFQCNSLVPKAVVGLVAGVTEFTGSQKPKNTQPVAKKKS